MRAKSFMFANGDRNGVLHVEGFEDTQLELIGSNLPSTAKTGGPNHGSFGSSFKISLKRGQSGIVAINVRRAKTSMGAAGFKIYDFILKIAWPTPNDIPVIDLFDQWTAADPTRLGAIKNQELEVRINGVAFTTQYNAAHRWTVDGNLLCQYLVGEIPADHVFAAAGKSLEKQANFVEMYMLQQEIKGWSRTSKIWEKEIEHLRAQVRQLLQKERENEEALRQAILVNQSQAALIKEFESKNYNLCAMVREWLTEIYGGKDDIDQEDGLQRLLWVMHQKAQRRIISRNETLDWMGQKIKALDKTLQITAWNPTRRRRIIQAAQDLIFWAKENDVIHKVPEKIQIDSSR